MNIKPRSFPFNGSAVTSWHGFDTPVQYSIWDAPKLDSLMIIGESTLTHYSQAQLHSWLRFLGRQDIRIGAIGYAIMTCAEAGIYNGYKCTAHWSQHASLVEKFEEVEVVPDLFVFDRNRFSCAGGVATFDLMLSIIKDDLGNDIARRCANFFNHDRIRSGSEPQRLPHNVTASYPNVKIQRAINIINEEIGQPADPERAEQAGRGIQAASGAALCQTSGQDPAQLCGGDPALAGL